MSERRMSDDDLVRLIWGPRPEPVRRYCGWCLAAVLLVDLATWAVVIWIARCALVVFGMVS